MATAPQNLLVKWYHTDPRLDDYYLMSTPWSLVGILILYLLVVLKIGPLYMKNKRPFELSKVIMAYNFLQIVLNCALFIWALGEWSKMNILCSPVDRSNSPHAVTVLNLHYSYCLLKLLDLLDTGFFVLRKKYNQVTFLHLYHHTLMVSATWISCKFFNGGQVYYLGVINVFVHAVMYGYYLVTSWRNEYGKNVWWKKYITQLQMVQHCLVFLIFLVACVNPNCDYPKEMLVFYITQSLLMITLFVNFYCKTYVKEKKKLK